MRSGQYLSRLFNFISLNFALLRFFYVGLSIED